MENERVIMTSTLSERLQPQLKSFSCWTAQLLPLILLSDQSFWHFSHPLGRRWTVKGTLPYPTHSNSNAFRCLSPSWTELSLLNTNGNWGVETDPIHQKSRASHLEREQRNSHGKTLTHILTCAITASLVLWESIFLYYLRWLLLFHSLLTNLLTSK